jgi:hypothetical protein
MLNLSADTVWEGVRYDCVIIVLILASAARVPAIHAVMFEMGSHPQTVHCRFSVNLDATQFHALAEE